MGLTVGIVAAPCIGPFVLSLLTYVAAKGEPLTGFILFFVLSAGLGLPYLFLGTFSGSIQNLPRSGEWMVWIKKVFGYIMIAMAVYFVSTLIPGLLYIILLSLTLITGGLAVGFFDKSQASFEWFGRIKAVVGTALIVAGLWQGLSAWQSANAPAVSWQPYQTRLIDEAQQQGKPVIIDFYADWCIPCKQLDKTLFSHPDVVDVSGHFQTLKADLTQEKSQETQTLRQQFNVLGVPTIVLLDQQGREVTRFTDELLQMHASEFITILENILEKQK
jgi:thiol:disulfide interchange protein DsbD